MDDFAEERGLNTNYYILNFLTNNKSKIHTIVIYVIYEECKNNIFKINFSSNSYNCVKNISSFFFLTAYKEYYYFIND